MAESEKRVHETDDEDESCPSSSKKKAKTTVKSGCQTFLPRYQEKYPFLIASRKGKHFAHCTLCKSDFSVRASGKYDCKRHEESASHRQFADSDSKTKQTKLSMFLPKENKADSQDNSLERATMRAEAMICRIIADSNLSIATADTMTKAMKAVFPDSKIAAGLQCSRSKATAVIKEMASQESDNLRERMKSGPYTLSTDGSNDSDAKQFPLVVRTLNTDTGLVTSELLAVPICEGSATGENIFQLVDRELHSHRIPWKNCISLGCDNANVMVGKHKGVYGFVKKEHPEVFLAGCTLHMVHNAAKHAATCLPPFEAVLVDIYFYLEKGGGERVRRLEDLQRIFDVEHRKILKHVPTRWLSISRCLQRLLENWDALKVYFCEEKEEQKKNPKRVSSYAMSKVENVFDFIRSPTNRLYLLFLSYTVKVFDHFLLTFQSGEPQIHKLQRGLERLLTVIMCRFVKPSARKDRNVLEINFKDEENMVSDEELGIGEDALNFIEKKKEHHLKDSRIAEFYSNVKAYFVKLVCYLKSRLPVDDPVLKHAEVADVSLQNSASLQSLRFFNSRYPCLMPPGADMNILTEQFSEYRGMDISACIAERVDETWRNIGRLCPDGASFQELSLFMRGILTIPHGSAHCERIFSCVRKNRTPQRSSLSESTMESLLVLKSSPLGPVEAVTRLKNDSLDALKSAYAKSLKGN